MHTDSISHMVTDTIVERKRIAHISIEIREGVLNYAYAVYAVTQKQGTRFIDTASSIVEAQGIATREIELIRERIETRRKGKPTANQLLVLFDLQVPIPLTLTYGQAWDMIAIALPGRNVKAKRAKLHRLGNG